MSRYQARGTQRERAVENVLRGLGYLTASRRHLEGPADLLALHLHHPPLLVEVKGTTDPPWRSGWGPADRCDLLTAGLLYGAEAMLAWWPPHGGLFWLPPSEWP